MCGCSGVGVGAWTVTQLRHGTVCLVCVWIWVLLRECVCECVNMLPTCVPFVLLLRHKCKRAGQEREALLIKLSSFPEPLKCCCYLFTPLALQTLSFTRPALKGSSLPTRLTPPLPTHLSPSVCVCVPQTLFSPFRSSRRVRVYQESDCQFDSEQESTLVLTYATSFCARVCGACVCV